MSKLIVDNLSFSYGRVSAVENIHLTVPEGAFVGIIGPNGSGKSTILKNIYGGLAPGSGTIQLDGKNLKAFKSKALARKMAVVGQENAVPFNFSVREIVTMGRTPYKRLFEADTNEDRAIVDDAMSTMQIEQLADRDFSQLSGGEKQRVLIARALAQKTDLLVLDEPTNHLDICFQLQIFDVLKSSQKTVLAAIHDLNLASLYCDEIYVLNGKRIEEHGKTEDVLTAEMIQRVFRVKCKVALEPETGKSSIVFIPRIYHEKEKQP